MTRSWEKKNYIEIKYCELCGKVIPKIGLSQKRWEKRKFCGQECTDRNILKKKQEDIENKICIECGETFTRRDSNGRLCRLNIWENRIFCSDVCYRKHRKGKYIEIKYCEVCGKTISRKKGNRYFSYEVWEKKNFCSYSCSGISRRSELKNYTEIKYCIGCGKVFGRNLIVSSKEWEKRKYCHQKCQNTYRDFSWSEERKNRMRGPNHPRWQGGISREPYCCMWTKEYKEEIKERDGYKCQNPLCNHKLDKLTVHHINYLKFDCHPKNLITLCNSCNSKANFDRNWHTSFYQEIIRRIYLKAA